MYGAGARYRSRSWFNAPKAKHLLAQQAAHHHYLVLVEADVNEVICLKFHCRLFRGCIVVGPIPGVHASHFAIQLFFEGCPYDTTSHHTM